MAADHDPEDKLLERVRALLAKAESTPFEAEAEAFTVKAQELMARHSIDHAMVAQAERAASGRSEEPSSRRLPVDDPYASAKAMLLGAIASANRCAAVWAKDLGVSTVFGFDVDLEMVDLLYTSLLVQATTAIVAAGSQVDQYGRSRTRSFRQAFLVSYAHRIGQRLDEVMVATEKEAAESGLYGTSLVPVLAERAEQVNQARDEAFPRLRTVRGSVSNRAGWTAGRLAADRANLGPSTALPNR